MVVMEKVKRVQVGNLKQNEESATAIVNVTGEETGNVAAWELKTSNHGLSIRKARTKV